MNLYVHTALSPAGRVTLLAGLPADTTVTFCSDSNVATQHSAFARAEFILGNPPAAWFQENLPTALRFWQLDSAGFDPYANVATVPALRSAQVANMGDFFAWPCAETTVAGLLALFRYVPQLAVWQRHKHWEGPAIRTQMRLLRGQRSVILGAGAIGQAIAQMLRAFECPVQFLARTHPDATLHSVDDLLRVLPNTDLLINTLPGSARGFVSAEVLAALPAHAVFANIGRGSTVDEPALIEALRSGRLGGAVLDVTATEPLPPDSPLWTLPNVLLTQHTGGGQPDEEAGKVAQFLRNLTRFQAGQPLENLVNLGRGY